MSETTIESNKRSIQEDVKENSENEEDDGWIGPLPSMMNDATKPKKRKGNNFEVMFYFYYDLKQFFFVFFQFYHTKNYF